MPKDPHKMKRGELLGQVMVLKQDLKGQRQEAREYERTFQDIATAIGKSKNPVIKTAIAKASNHIKKTKDKGAQTAPTALGRLSKLLPLPPVMPLGQSPSQGSSSKSEDRLVRYGGVC
eukprot:5767342-Pyramimonas_sp.AAC.2